MIVFLTNPKREIALRRSLPREIPAVRPAANTGEDGISPLRIEQFIGERIDEYIFTGKKTEMREPVLQLTGNFPELKWHWLKNYYGYGDVIITEYMVNFSPNVGKAVDDILNLYRQGHRVICLNEKFDSVNLYQVEMLHYMQPMLRLFYEGDKLFRRNAIIHNEGNKKIRKKAYTLDQFPQFFQLYPDYVQGHLTKKDFAEILKISRPTLDKFVREYEERDITVDDIPEIKDYFTRVRAGEISEAEAAARLKISLKTLRRLFREYAESIL